MTSLWWTCLAKIAYAVSPAIKHGVRGHLRLVKMYVVAGILYFGHDSRGSQSGEVSLACDPGVLNLGVPHLLVPVDVGVVPEDLEGNVGPGADPVCGRSVDGHEGSFRLGGDIFTVGFDIPTP
jgi:hypothetical protein